MSVQIIPAVDEQAWRVCDHCGAESLHASAALGNHLPAGWSTLRVVQLSPLDDDIGYDYCSACTIKLQGGLTQ